MDIRSRVGFTAGVEEVFTMMTDRTYLEEVCKATHARSYEATVTGTTTQTIRRLPAPTAAAKFTGPELTVAEKIDWGPADAAGNRTGRVSMSVPGQPVTMQGTVVLSIDGAGTVAELTGVLKVAIPILGKKLEQAAAPAVLAGFRTQQKVGDAWLVK